MDNMKMPLVQPAAAYQKTTVPTSAQAAVSVSVVPKSSGTIKTVVIVMLSLR